MDRHYEELLQKRGITLDEKDRQSIQLSAKRGDRLREGGARTLPDVHAAVRLTRLMANDFVRELYQIVEMQVRQNPQLTEERIKAICTAVREASPSLLSKEDADDARLDVLMDVIAAVAHSFWKELQALLQQGEADALVHEFEHDDLVWFDREECTMDEIRERCVYRYLEMRLRDE